MRWPRRAALAAAALCALAWAAERAGGWLKPAAVRIGERVTGLPFAIDTLTLGLLPPRLEATGLEMGSAERHRAAGSPWLRVRALSVTPHVGSLLVLWPVLANVEADGVAVDARLPAEKGGPEAGESAMAGFDPRGLALPFDVRAARIGIDRLHLDARARPDLGVEDILAQEATLEATAAGWRERQLRVKAQRLALTPRAEGTGGRARVGQLAMEATVHGSLRRPRHVQLGRLIITGPGTRLEVHGHARLEGPEAPLSVALTARTAAASPWWAGTWPKGGILDHWQSATARGEARLEGDWRSLEVAFGLELWRPADAAQEAGGGISGTGGTAGTSGCAGGGASCTSGPRGTSGTSGAGGTSSSSGSLSAEEGENEEWEGLSLIEDPFLRKGSADVPRREAGTRLRASGRLSGQRLELAAVRLCFDGRCGAEARGSLQRTEGRFQGTVRLDRLPLERALRALWASQAPPLSGHLSGRATLSGVAGGPSRSASLRTEVDLRNEQLRLWPQRRPRAGGSSAAPIVGLVPARLRARIEAGPRQVALRAGELAVADDTLMLEGEWHPPDHERAGLQARLWTDGFPFEALGPIASVPYRGRLAFGGSLEAPPGGAVRARASVQADRLAIGPVHVGTARGLVSYADQRLVLARVVNTRGAGQLAGDLAIDFSGRQPTLEADVSAERVEADRLLLDLSLPEAVATPVSARLWGSLRCEGALSAPTGQAHLQAPRLRLGEVDLGRAELHLSSGQGERRIGGTLLARGERSTVEGEASLSNGGNVHVRLQATDVPLLALLPSVSHRAALTLRLALDGRPKALAGTLNAYVRRRPKALSASEPTPLASEASGGGGLALLMRAEGGGAHFDLHAFEGALGARGSLKLSSPFPVDLRGQLRNLEWADLAQWLPALARASKQASAGLDGEFSVSGPLSEPTALDARLHVARLEGRLVAAPIALSRAVTLTLARGRLRVPPVQLKSRTLTADVRGDWQLVRSPGTAPAAAAGRGRGALALDATVSGDLSALGPWVPALTAAKGHMRAALSLQGDFAHPLLFGEAEVQNGALRIPLGDQPLEHVALKMLFSGRALALTVGHASVGRGRLSLQGEWALGDGHWLDPKGALSLRTRLEHVPFRPMPDLSSRLSGNLELSGEHDAFKLQGDLRVESMRYTARLDFDRLLRKRRAPPLKASFLPFSRPVALALKLRAQNDAIISSKVLEAEMAGDLLLTGTTDRLGLLGSVTPLWARARYRDNVFVISRATVDFTDDYRIAPVYSIEGRTRACQMDTSVVVQGDSEGYQLTPSGRDEHGSVDPQDVLSCLHLGVRLSDFAGPYGHTAGFGDALSGSFDALWTVSGMDDKVRKFLPIRVDELRLTSGWSSINQRTTPKLVVGRELGRHVALRYARSIDELSDQALTVETKLTPQRTLQFGYMSARDAPTGDFGVDLRLHWELR